ncbi:MAG: LytTR family DNA-binding domain-containing protein [Oscillospiraceae bacterium]|nr:LytTR family DNA-binding domain-containing protein [Oscillospiraceae bacterium]
MIRIAICDDDKQHGELLEKNVSLFLAQNKTHAAISFYEQSKMLFFDIDEGKHFDLLLSDIEMPEIDGMELAKIIKERLPDLMIIFITSHIKYAVDAYALSIFRYIPKTELGKRLPRALADAVNMLQLQAEEYYTISTPTRYEKIPLQKIIYVRREGKNALIIQLNGQIVKVRKSLSQVYEELGSADFLYVGRGDIVNILHIMNMKNGMIELKNGERIPVSQSNLNEIKEKLNDFWGKQI